MEEMQAVLLWNPPNHLHLSSSNTTTAAANIVASRPPCLDPPLGELSLCVKESGGLTFTSCLGELCSGLCETGCTFSPEKNTLAWRNRDLGQVLEC